MAPNIYTFYREIDRFMGICVSLGFTQNTGQGVIYKREIAPHTHLTQQRVWCEQKR